MTEGSWFSVAVIVTHEGPGERIARCLRALDAAGGPDAVVVVDNSGRGCSVGDPRPAYGPGVSAIVTTVNRGFGAAANDGFEWAADHLPSGCSLAVALLNDDVTVRKGWFRPLLAALDGDGAVGAVQPKILFSDGRVNSVGVELDRYHAGADVAYGSPDGPELAGTAPIEAFSGGAVLFRGSYLADLGGFDERFFLYYEDVDLALRGRRCGWRYLCQRDAVVEHEFGASTGALGDARLRLQERNRLWTAARHAPLRTIGAASWLSVRRLAHPPRRAHARALLAGIAGFAPRVVERCRAKGPLI